MNEGVEKHTTTPQTIRAGRAAQSPFRRWTFRTAAILVSLVLLAGIELGFRLSGVGYDPSFIVPGDLDGKPTYRENERFSWRFFPPAIARTPMPFHLPRVKGDRACRVFVLGASAAQGDPDPAFSIARIVQVMLEDAFPGREFEVLNGAIAAINSHVVLEMARDCARYDPDLFVIYLGNNEVIGPYGPGTILNQPFSGSWQIRLDKWISATRTGQLAKSLMSVTTDSPSDWGGMQDWVEKSIAVTDPRLAIVRRHFRQNLDSIAAIARGIEIPVILCTVGVNLHDSAPFSSLHRPDLSPTAAAEWQGLYEAAQRQTTDGHNQEALALYEQALAIDSQYADLSYRLGQCCEALGMLDKAREHYLRARDLDALRFRCDTELNSVIRQVAADWADRGVHLLDVEQILADQSPHRLPGRTLLLDHVHLRFRGNYLISYEIAQRAAALLQCPHPADFEPLSESGCRRRLCYTGFDEHRILTKMLRRMSAAPFTNQLDHQAQIAKLKAEIAGLSGYTEAEGLRETAALYESAVSARPADWLICYNYGYVLEKLNDRQRWEEMRDRAKRYYRRQPSTKP
jgi:tetratricopeptide (TPR) repeat protein